MQSESWEHYMAAKILDGKKLADEFLHEITSRVHALKALHVAPGIAAILVGEDEASRTYVGMKREAAEKCGFHSVVRELPSSSATEEVIAAIAELNSDPAIHGIMVQLPLPKGVDRAAVLESILPSKDVDGLTSTSLGAIASRMNGFVPATARGVIELLKLTGVALKGKSACVIGEGMQTGRPIALLLLNEFATVTVCHVHTHGVAEIAANSDILVSAVGKPNLVDGGMVKQGAIAIDVGISKAGGKVAGDFDFDSVSHKAAWVTPVPGGVGPMTVAMLLLNTVEAAERTL